MGCAMLRTADALLGLNGFRGVRRSDDFTSHDIWSRWVYRGRIECILDKEIFSVVVSVTWPDWFHSHKCLAWKAASVFLARDKDAAHKASRSEYGSLQRCLFLSSPKCGISPSCVCKGHGPCLGMNAKGGRLAALHAVVQI